MGHVRRVVTSTGAEGRSSVVSDGRPATEIGESGGGPRLSVLWEVTTPVGHEDMGGDPIEVSPLPLPGVARFLRLVLPGHASDDGGDLDVGMHRTDTLDLIHVAAGGVDLVLDSGPVHLDESDHVVIQGDVHGWRVTSAEDCVLIAVMLGIAPRG